ncbi:MAG: YhfC family intramembrane metalloprotease [Chloroflexi bacterium]|nr:YhfC family intramembrane metalloprotease [Chloroflexota bacterium]
MLYITYTLNFLLMIAIPIIVAVVIHRRLGGRWALMAWGAAAFIGSQVVRIPLLYGLTALFQSGALPRIPANIVTPFNIAVLSISAGLFEETARYIVYRRFIPAARTWNDGIALGIGHGGIEAILLGLFTGLGVIQMFALRGVDLAALPLQPDQLAAAQKQVADFWSAAWYLTLFGAVERAFAICLHLSLSLLVLQTFRRNIVWLFAATGWHALANAVTVSVLPSVGPLATEGILGLFALASMGIIAGLRRTGMGADSVVESESIGEPVSVK